jgi:hypothetical protein
MGSKGRNWPRARYFFDEYWVLLTAIIRLTLFLRPIMFDRTFAAERRCLLSEVDSGRKNNLNLIRFVLASGVVFSHCYAILGEERNEPLSSGLHFGGNLGDLAVFGFFFISGYLITRSAQQGGGHCAISARAYSSAFPRLGIGHSFLCLRSWAFLDSFISPFVFRQLVDVSILWHGHAESPLWGDASRGV